MPVTDTAATPTATPPAVLEPVMLFYGAHRASPFTPRRAVVIDEVGADSGRPATEDDPGQPPTRIVNVLVYNSALLDNGRPEVEQVRNVLVLAPGAKLTEGEETPWEWPALNFVSATVPETEPRAPRTPAEPAKEDAPAPRRRRAAPAPANDATTA